MTQKQRAQELHSQAMQMEDDDKALQLYQQALALDPEKSESWYNIGLIHKYCGEWQASFDANLKAYHLDDASEAVCWNLAIAATALQDWKTARQVWNHLGVAIEPGETEIEADFGLTPVRLNPDDEAEVVWARRIDPVRARLQNIPFPESGYCYGDIVLHDGAPVGYRTLNGKEVAVFNTLLLMRTSALSTWVVEVLVECEQDVFDLEQRFEQEGIPCECWQQSIQFLCRQCSEGIPHEHHDDELSDTDTGTSTKKFNPHQSLGVACESEEKVQQICAQWCSDQRKVLDIACALQREHV